MRLMNIKPGGNWRGNSWIPHRCPIWLISLHKFLQWWVWIQFFFKNRVWPGHGEGKAACKINIKTNPDTAWTKTDRPTESVFFSLSLSLFLNARPLMRNWNESEIFFSRRSSAKNKREIRREWNTSSKERIWNRTKQKGKLLPPDAKICVSRPDGRSADASPRVPESWVPQYNFHVVASRCQPGHFLSLPIQFSLVVASRCQPGHFLSHFS